MKSAPVPPLFALLLLFALPGAHAAAAGLLDGVTIAAAFTDTTGKSQGEDRLVFAGGTLDVPGIHKAYAFATGAYTAEKKKDGSIAFTATLVSAQHGSLVIAGSIAKQAASGTRTWSKPGKQPIEHIFTGTLADADTGAKRKK